ncbi:MAG: hypothetical protein K2I06_03660 [Ruminococcus sp.]|nr:hypothetical protein [Ruminococcus sp.]
MIVPFNDDTAYEVIKKISKTSKGKVIKNIEDWFEKFPKRTFTGKANIIIGVEDSITIWVYACIFYDIAYDNDCSQFCTHKGKSYSDKYIKVRDDIKEEFNRKKTLSKKYVYDRADIISNITSGLRDIAGLPTNVTSEIMKQMNSRSRETGKKYKSTFLELEDKLCRWIDTLYNS